APRRANDSQRDRSVAPEQAKAYGRGDQVLTRRKSACGVRWGAPRVQGERVRAAAIARARSVSRPTHRMTVLGARVRDVWEAIEVHETRAVELGPSVLAKGCDSGSQCGRSSPAQLQLLWEVPEAGSETHRRTWCLHLR